MGAANSYAFIVSNPTPFQRFNNIIFRARNIAGLIGILNAEQEFSIMLFGKQIVIQRSAHAADVQRTGRAGGKPYSYFFHSMLFCAAKICIRYFRFYNGAQVKYYS
ncbi:hypothetical protein DSECCO2_243060 [anaerobic digester metagenome]